ncbi:L,D-transpeptidase [Pseudogemmobacter bohemicus]|uniref:L,D-transpeptidase n=1 Tax=Pseudogemmobacter bohemicus TaxID=2250708 RepID=UPI001E521D6A|nr:L,D-transpeptidase [Pseudogemmobacter bohemicus]
MRADLMPALALILALASTPLRAETQPQGGTDAPAAETGPKFVKPKIITSDPAAEDPVQRAATIAEEILSAATLPPEEPAAPAADETAAAEGAAPPAAAETATAEETAPKVAETAAAVDAAPKSGQAAVATVPTKAPPAPAIPEDVVLAVTSSGVNRAVAIVEELTRETIEVRVSISQQMMEVWYKGEMIHEWPVSTARKGKVTPKGSFKPQWLSKNHKSSLYNNAPMPYSIFYSGNYAIHGTDQESKLGRPASAGCVRLSRANAKILFAMVQQEGKSKMKVEILD